MIASFRALIESSCQQWKFIPFPTEECLSRPIRLEGPFGSTTSCVLEKKNILRIHDSRTRKMAEEREIPKSGTRDVVKALDDPLLFLVFPNDQPEGSVDRLITTIVDQYRNM